MKVAIWKKIECLRKGGKELAEQAGDSERAKEREIRMKQRYKEKVEEIILNQRKIGKGGLDEKKGRENS